MTHSFYVEGGEPTDLARELRECGWGDVILDEEDSGDGRWHIAAFRVETPVDADAAKQSLRTLAARYGGSYTGWKITLTASGERPRADRPLF